MTALCPSTTRILRLFMASLRWIRAIPGRWPSRVTRFRSLSAANSGRNGLHAEHVELTHGLRVHQADLVEAGRGFVHVGKNLAAFLGLRSTFGGVACLFRPR